jgi:hypothetical protein
MFCDTDAIWQWGYFEVGMYTGEREVRKDVLKEFKMGRLDVGLYRGLPSTLSRLTLY